MNPDIKGKMFSAECPPGKHSVRVRTPPEVFFTLISGSVSDLDLGVVISLFFRKDL